ncbi:hypothetical protein [Alteriqipengyuania lutimaris]|uniref:Ferrochelatase n=1 Tax=Alteriqipengyuania lutimaris TaxID=1538146 RepID=A0A395LS98_9SPHN|nr:hypothetical protein [Alteriqipengyuania lutimaris]MBB3032545.1 hypothetical protein [Alteriqipengyuania lutimaris]RDS78324.1 hypothetical protein DL238_12410 [Alteriqipengyuania lutimaris]
MKLGKTFAVVAAATLATAPIAAQADVRASAPVDGESEVGGGAYTPLILLAIVGIGIGIAASGGDDEAVSP